MTRERLHAGRVSAIFRHPIKSMKAHRLDTATLDAYGIAGDRRFAFRRAGVQSGMPWLTAGRMPDMLLYRPIVDDGGDPTHVETPSGQRLELWSIELQKELSERFGSPLELMKLDSGIFDAAGISIISTATVAALEAETGRDLDIRRFRPNLVVEMTDGAAFREDTWVGGSVTFGNDGPHVAVTQKDIRCVMIGLDPDTVESDPSILKATGRMNDVCAGVYGTVLRPGNISVGDDVFVLPQ